MTRAERLAQLIRAEQDAWFAEAGTFLDVESLPEYLGLPPGSVLRRRTQPTRSRGDVMKMRFTVIHHNRADDIYDLNASADECDEFHWQLLTAWNGRQPTVRVNGDDGPFDVDLADVILIKAEAA